MQCWLYLAALSLQKQILPEKRQSLNQAPVMPWLWLVKKGSKRNLSERSSTKIVAKQEGTCYLWGSSRRHSSISEWTLYLKIILRVSRSRWNLSKSTCSWNWINWKLRATTSVQQSPIMWRFADGSLREDRDLFLACGCCPRLYFSGRWQAETAKRGWPS